MKLSTTKLVLLLVLIVCMVSSKVFAHHHDWEDDCDDDNDWNDEENDDWKYEDHNDWNNGDDWDNNNNRGWNNNNNGQAWGNSGQGWSSDSRQSGTIVVSSTVWPSLGYPIPTNVNGQPTYYYPSGSQSGVYTATWAQGNTGTIRPTYANGQNPNSASAKSVGIPVLLAAIMFSMVIAA